MKIVIPRYLNGIIKTFFAGNHQLYLVGGCLRDIIIGKTPHDFDLATSAMPDEVSNLFPKTISVGKQFGTIIIPIGCHNIEVTTLRKEGTYLDGRHPDQVTFCKDILLDLARRDFTMNALAYDLKKGNIIDPYNGRTDIKEKIIRGVGNPQDRLQEDTLRVFRAARFASQLSFSIEKNTEQAIQAISGKLKLPAAERIRNELIKLLKGNGYISGLSYLDQWNLLDKIFQTSSGVFTKYIPTIPTDFDIYQRLAYLVSLIEKPNRETTLLALRFTKKETRTILDLGDNHYDYTLAKFTIKNLTLTGKELKELGYHGIEIGKIQRMLLENVKSGLLKNTKKELMTATFKDLPLTL